MFADAICILNEKKLKGDFHKFGAPTVVFEKTVCTPLVEAIHQEFEQKNISHVLLDREKAKKFGVTIELDHGVLVPMYFMDKTYKDYEIVHITPGALSLRELYTAGQAVTAAIDRTGLKTVAIASGDLSHYLVEEGPYGYRKEGEQLDQEIVAAFR